MVLKRFVRVFVVVLLFGLLIGSSVMADDGRINRTPYHFGGDTLYCNEEEGCTLLNITGLGIANWPQADIATAFATVDQTGVNTRVGVREGTYGPMQLWAVSPDATTGNNTLCLIGFDEWFKLNDMCFQVTPDFKFLQAGLPVPAPVVQDDGTVIVPPPPPTDCSMWNVGDTVKLITGDYTTAGQITSIDTTNGTVTVDTKPSYTAGCDEVEIAIT